VVQRCDDGVWGNRGWPWRLCGNLPGEPCRALVVEIRWSNLNTENIPLIGTPLSVSKNLFRSTRRTHRPVGPLYPSKAPPGSSPSFSVRLTRHRQSLPERSESLAGQAFLTCPSSDLQGHPFPNILLCAGESAQKWDLSYWTRLLLPKPFGDYNSQISA